MTAGRHADPMKIDEGTAQFWDGRYAAEPIWSGNPNGGLVAEVSDLPPGRALDVGCGEGADAIWLARRGWDVTALDVSAIALARARAAADVNVHWVLAGLVEAGLRHGCFDLVSAQYPALLKTPDDEAERTLLALVAPGGTLLAVHHADMDAEHGKAHGFDPADYVSHEDLLALLDSTWRLDVVERRARHLTTGAGAGHSHDLVLRARRLV